MVERCADNHDKNTSRPITATAAMAERGEGGEGRGASEGVTMPSRHKHWHDGVVMPQNMA